MSTNDLDTLIKEIRERKIRDTEGEELAEKNKIYRAFDKKFLEIYQAAQDLAMVYNARLKEVNFSLEVIKGIYDPFSNRKSFQVVLRRKDLDYNLLENPYLLVEGYVKSNELKIVDGRSALPGKTMNIYSFKTDSLPDEMGKFLKHNLVHGLQDT